MEPALDELTERGYCTWALTDSQTESGKKLVFDRIRTPTLALSPESEGLAALSPTQRDLLEALTDRGLSVSAARSLVTENDTDVVGRQLRHFDWLLAQDDPPKSAGWFVAAVEKDFGLPPALLAQDKSAARQAQARASTSARQSDDDGAQAAARARANREHEAVRARLAALPEAQRTSLEARAVAALDPVNRKRYRADGLDARGLRVLVEDAMAVLLDSDLS